MPIHVPRWIQKRYIVLLVAQPPNTPLLKFAGK